MTKEDVKKAAEVMLAYANGKEIEYFDVANGKWHKCVDPQFEWIKKYRIKTEPKYRPFEDGNECWEELLKHQPYGWIQDHTTDNFKRYILSVDLDGVMTADYEDGTIYQDFEALFNLTSFIDGTPFGIKCE